MPTPNYRTTLSFDRERNVFVARAPELPHCSGEGASRAEAVARLEEEIEAQVQNMRAHGSNPPAPVDEEALSGEIAVKVSQALHRDLLWQARSEGIELPHLLGEILAAAVEARRGTRGARAGGNRHEPAGVDGNGNRGNGNRGNYAGGNGGRYQNNLLDDRANFIEYVRNLEQGQAGD